MNSSPHPSKVESLMWILNICKCNNNNWLVWKQKVSDIRERLFGLQMQQMYCIYQIYPHIAFAPLFPGKNYFFIFQLFDYFHLKISHFQVTGTTSPSHLNSIYYIKNMADNVQCVKHSADNPFGHHQIQQKNPLGGAPSCPITQQCWWFTPSTRWVKYIVVAMLTWLRFPYTAPQVSSKHSFSKAMSAEQSWKAVPRLAMTAALERDQEWSRSCQWQGWMAWCQRKSQSYWWRWGKQGGRG